MLTVSAQYEILSSLRRNKQSVKCLRHVCKRVFNNSVTNPQF
ncbi:hypothetical protein [Yersinia phage vB_YenM_P778]